MVRRLQVHQRCAAKTEESLMAVHATKSAKTRGKKMMTMLDPFGKSKRRVQKKYLVCRNGLKFEVI